jgi:tetratricopeptide (TPR) repeat protein
VLQLWAQFNMFFDDLQAQFNIFYALLALLGLFFFRDLDEIDSRWMKFLFVAFLCLSVGFIFFSNPPYDRQKQFTERVFFLPCHCLYALWVGYGLMLGVGYYLAEKPALRDAAIPAAILVCLLPVASLWRNWAGHEKHGHEFGYEFGYRLFKPGGDYAEMDRQAILFGGTDPGRCVPTYMIFVESFASPGNKSQVDGCPESGTFDRRDVYILSQNALAERSYVDYIRDQYGSRRPRGDDPGTLTNRGRLYDLIFGAAWKTLGRDTAYPDEPIWIPSPKDTEDAFGRYVEELKTRAPLPGEEVKIENGHVSVSGVAGIMAVNGILTRDVFEHNKGKHTFYVEESYIIPWMYPYLEPYGIIMKLNPNPVPEFSPALVERDTNYWNELTAQLQGDPKFQRDEMAQKTYAKLRSAIGGLYANRHMNKEAEDAFTQAIQLCPAGPDGNFRLAQLYVDEHRYDDAIKVLLAYQKLDRFNGAIMQAGEQIKQLHADSEAIADLEKQYAVKPGDLGLGMQLARAYAAVKRVDQLDVLTSQLTASPDLSPNDYLALINFDAQLNRGDRVLQMLGLFTQRFPQNALGWFNLATILSLQGDCNGSLPALTRALALDGPDQKLHALATHDRRLSNCRGTMEFQRLITSSVSLSVTGTPPPGLPFKIGP